MNNVLQQLLSDYMRYPKENPPDSESQAHDFLEYILESGYPLSDFSEDDLQHVAAQFNLDETQMSDLLEDAAMWLT